MENAVAVGGRFAGSTALIVGAAGIGRATAVRLAREGAGVHLADIEPAAVDEALGALPGGGHSGVPVDVRSVQSVEQAIRELAATAPALDVLVVVAGGDTEHGGFEDTGDDVWRSMFELNALGPVRIVRAALPLLRRSARGAAVAVVSSVNARLTAGSLPYSAAKAAVERVVASLAAELGPQGIRVNAVRPGTVRTRVWDDQGGPDRLAVHYPLGRVGEPDDITGAVAFLCSADAAWITGVSLPVDGGLSIRRVFSPERADEAGVPPS